MDNLKEAHRKARKGKSFYREVQMVDNDEDFFLNKIRRSLLNQTFTTSQYTIKEIEDRGKTRTIFILPYYPDRIIQWAIMLQLEQMFMNNFIFDTYASIPGRGAHLAVQRLDQKIIEGNPYCFKFDIKKYFPSINQNILYCLLERKIKDKDLLNLLWDIIKSILFGIPIGNYLSQWLANFNFSWVDHWAKEWLNLNYFRYMDDVVIVDNDWDKLFDVRRDFIKYLNTNLNLQLKDNHQIFKIQDRGIDFLGYKCFGHYRLLRKRIVNNIKKNYKVISNKKVVTKHDINSMMSYKGWLDYCNSFNFKNKYFGDCYESTIALAA
jgi:retron-type reverse transcriptase